MSRDFTVKTFEQLLKTLLAAGYTFITFAEYCSFPDVWSKEARERGSELDHSHFALQNTDHRPPITDHPKRFVILRHDVDALPLNSLRLAQLENSLGIRGTYYFRAQQYGFEEEIIRRIATLGHEIGYHYETVAQVNAQAWIKTLCDSVSHSVNLSRLVGTSRVTKKKQSPEERNIHQAYDLFIHNLEKLRRITPVYTICMHGSPLSPFKNLDIWKTYDHRKLGILGEPYLDIDFSRVFYLTDTGRRWDGDQVNIRDKVYDKETKRQRDEETKRRGSEGANKSEITNFTLSEAKMLKSEIKNILPNALCPEPCALSLVPSFHRTCDILRSVREGTFPNQAMINLHPQRWNNALISWLKELVWQNLKNPFKWLIIKINR